MIAGYFDESGHSADTDFVTMGGLVAPEEEWSALIPKWKELLSKHKLSEWHSHDYAHSVNEYKRWNGNDEGRQNLYGDFMGAIIEMEGVPLGATVSVAHWRRMSDAARRSLVDPYYLTLQLCLHRSSDYRSGMFWQEKMRLVFDDNREFKGRIPAIYRMLRNNIPFGDQLLERPTFVSATAAPQMQVADLIAYEVRQFHHNHLKRPCAAPRWGYVRLVEMVLRSCKFGPLPWFWNLGEEALAELEKSVEQSWIDDAV
jgi:hypothetical protein